MIPALLCSYTVIFILLGLAKDMIVAGCSHALCLISRGTRAEGQRITAKSATLQSHVPHPRAAGIAEDISYVLWGKEKSTDRNITF